MTFLLIGMTYCQMLSEDVKTKIPYPKSETWGKIPSWAHSIVYAAEIFQLYKNNSTLPLYEMDIKLILNAISHKYKNISYTFNM